MFNKASIHGILALFFTMAVLLPSGCSALAAAWNTTPVATTSPGVVIGDDTVPLATQDDGGLSNLTIFILGVLAVLIIGSIIYLLLRRGGRRDGMHTDNIYEEYAHEITDDWGFDDEEDDDDAWDDRV